jgi:hypothetical protein
MQCSDANERKNKMSNMANQDWREDLRKLREPSAPEIPAASVAEKVADIFCDSPAPVAVESSPRVIEWASPSDDAVNEQKKFDAQMKARQKNAAPAPMTPALAPESEPESKVGRPKVYASEAEKMRAYRERHKPNAPAAFAASVAEQQNTPAEPIVESPTPNEIILPAGLDLSGLRERGANVAPAPAQPAPAIVQATPAPIVELAPAPSEPTFAEQLEAYRAEKLAAEARAEEMSQINIREIKEQERLKRVAAQEKWDADYQYSREIHPMALTPVQEARLAMEREQNPVCGEYLAALDATEPDWDRPYDEKLENRTDLPPRSSRRIGWLIQNHEKGFPERQELRLRNDAARVAHRGR